MERMAQLEQMAQKHGGILKTSMVVDAGISKPTLSAFIKRYGFERISSGIYCDPDAWLDELYVLQLRCPSLIFSHDTALFLYDLTDREPIAPTVTARTGYKIYIFWKQISDSHLEYLVSMSSANFGSPTRW